MKTSQWTHFRVWSNINAAVLWSDTHLESGAHPSKWFKVEGGQVVKSSWHCNNQVASRSKLKCMSQCWQGMFRKTTPSSCSTALMHLWFCYRNMEHGIFAECCALLHIITKAADVPNRAKCPHFAFHIPFWPTKFLDVSGTQLHSQISASWCEWWDT